MSRSQSSLVNSIHTDWEKERTWFDELEPWKQRRYTSLAIDFYGGICAFNASRAPIENSPSFTNCERSPTPVESDSTGAEADELYQPEIEALPILMQMGVEDVERAHNIVAGGGDRLTAIYAALERGQERQWKVLSLLDRGDVGHAVRLASCGRRSVQLTCPEHFGGCGCEENYVPTTCDSRLCPDCQDKKVGQNIEKYRQAVFDMDSPTF